MLVLTRKLGERISIGHDVEVVVLKVSGNRVRLGISAPPDIPIQRGNTTGRLDDNTVEAVQSGMGSGQVQVVLCAGV
jgi:carbon storage regulator